VSQGSVAKFDHLRDHAIVLNERHLKRLMSEYVRYYHEDRTHLSLKKETPASQAAVENPGAGGGVLWAVLQISALNGGDSIVNLRM
jgi:hypothetical protein